MKIPHMSITWTDFKQNKYRKPLSDVVSLKVTENLNGSFDLEMTYPIQGQFANEIDFYDLNNAFVQEPIISAVPRKGSKEEPFRIYEIRKSLDGLMTVRAHHIVYDTDGIIIGPFSAVGISAVVSALNTHYSSDGLEFVVQNNGIVDTSTEFSSTVPCSLWSLIGAAATAFGAELSYEYDDFNSRVLIKLNANRGVAKQTVVGYGVNLVKAERTNNNSGLYTVCLPYAQQTNDDGTVTVVIGDSSGVIVGTDRSRTVAVDFSDNYDGLPDPMDLYMDAQQYRGYLGKVNKTISVDFVPLEDTTEGYGSSELALGDTVTVNAGALGTMTAKVVKTIYNPLTEKYETVSIGSVETTIADTIASATSITTSRIEKLTASGIQPVQSVSSGSVATISVSFGKTFGKVPVVVACLYSNQTVGLGDCSCSVYNITTTGFSLRLENNYTSARDLGATWIAM